LAPEPEKREARGDDAAETLVVRIDPSHEPDWDRYVQRHPDGTAYHLAAWASNLERTYRYRPLHLALRRPDGTLTGVLPLLTKRGIVSGRRVWSLPAAPTGGPLADDPAGAAALMGSACELARERSCELVVESTTGGLEALVPELSSSDQPPTWMLELPEEGLDGWLAERSRNLRRSIRKAVASPLAVRDDGGVDDLKAFHRLYAEAMRAKGTFPRPLAQMTRDCEALAPAGVFHLFVLENEGRQVGGMLCHALGETLDLMIIASEPSLQKLRPHHALYMRAIEWAAENGMRRVDFGWSAPGSNAEFKESWGARPLDRFAYRHPPSSDDSAVSAPRPADHPALKRIWDRTPLSIVSLAGSFAYRYL
jgi:hypothetical protein